MTRRYNGIPPGNIYGRTGPMLFPSSLLRELVGYWPLDETSGVRYDAHGIMHLSDVNTVGSVADGKSGVAALFEADEHLVSSITPKAMDKFTMAFWVRNVTAGTTGFMSLGGTGGWINGSSGTLYTNTGTQLTGVLSNFVAGDYSLNQKTGLDLTDGNWHFCLGRFSRIDGRIDLNVNNSWDKTNTLTATVPTANAPSKLYLHSYYDQTRDDNSCEMDEAMLWSRLLTDVEVTTLYNLGVGKFYPYK